MLLSLLLWNRFLPCLNHGGLAVGPCAAVFASLGGPIGAASVPGHFANGVVDIGAAAFAVVVGGAELRIEPPPADDLGGLALDSAPACIGSPLVSVSYAAYPELP